MTSYPVAVGLIGCGNISTTYLSVIAELPQVEVVACTDLRMDAAQGVAERFAIARVLDVDELLHCDEVEIVLNLTTPEAHGSLSLAALEAAKHTYNEKPLALTRDEGKRLLHVAERQNLRVGAAPDTFMGAGLQTCRQLIDEGAIGEPLAASAFMLCPGHEHWHPSPDFYYQPGGGPMFDMGPYYLTALISLLGPVSRVTGVARSARPTRTITSQPRYGQTIEVKVPTHITGIMEFSSGVIGTITTSFDVQASTLPPIEIYGSEATLRAPDPNTFGGPVYIKGATNDRWQEIAVESGYAKQSRGIGLADLAVAIRGNRPHRANGTLAYHVLDLMHAFHDASNNGCHQLLESTCTRPTPFPPALARGEVG